MSSDSYSSGHATHGAGVSLILIEIAGGAQLARCLASLVAFNQETIVVVREECPELQRSHPQVQFSLCADPVPMRRAHGARLASAEFVVLIEDTGEPAATLLQGVEQAFGYLDCAAASGPVEIGVELGARQQALACTEYGRYHAINLASDKKGPPVWSDRLPGNLLAYRREVLLRELDSQSMGLVEGPLHQRLCAAGGRLALMPDMALCYRGGDEPGARLMTRFQHGRIYAGELCRNGAWSKRFVHALKSLLLPLVLSLRHLRLMRRIPTIKRRLAVALWIILMDLFWSAGELNGSLRGRPADMEAWS